MIKIFSIILILNISLMAQELKIKAKNFHSNQKTGVSVFNGDVNIVKENDELNASKVTVYTDKDQKPLKFVAQGEVSFHITTQDGITYVGKADKAIYKPTQKDYFFYGNVYLRQVGEKNEIIGDEVVLKAIDGKAYANSKTNKPVMMIFDLDEKEK